MNNDDDEGIVEWHQVDAKAANTTEVLTTGDSFAVTAWLLTRDSRAREGGGHRIELS